MNTQPIEKRQERVDSLLSVHSIFHTIQGEGPFCGTPAVFIRLAGCNLQCPACDTDYTVGRKQMDVTGIAAEVDKLMPAPRRGLVVITGGEPFRQSLGELLYWLIGLGFYVQIETNGTLEPERFDYSTDPGKRKGVYVVCSPKTGKIHPRVYEVACALKYVVEKDWIRTEDGLPLRALGHTALPYPARPPEWWGRPVYVQPLDSKDESANIAHLSAAIGSCMAHGHILQLQVHKLIGVE